MIRILKWVGIVLGCLVILMVLASLLLPTLVNLDRYRGVLASRASKALGREVTLGSLRVDLWGGIGAEAKGIQIAQAPGFGSEPFVAADALRVRVQFLPLLHGQLKVFLLGLLKYGSGAIAHVQVAALAGVTAWMGLCLLDWSAWRRLPKMSRVDAAAFLATAGAVLSVNAVYAVAIGCSLYAARALYRRCFPATESVPDLQTP